MEDLTLPVEISGEHVLDKEGLLSRQWWSNSDITASVLPFIAIVGFFLFGWLFQLWLLLRVADESFLHHRHRFHHRRRHHRWGPARTNDWDDYYDPEEEDWNGDYYDDHEEEDDWGADNYSSRSNKRKRRIRRPSYTN